MKKKEIPKLRILTYKNKKHLYKLNDNTKKRRLAIDEGIQDEYKKKKSIRKAAISKKKRFNVLRIYRKNKNYIQCKKITDDMKYIDKKYKTGKTNNICKKNAKGGNKSEYFFNPNNPKKSFDVYKDKNPKDTINIKYKTLKDVKNTIKKLETLYKNNKYTHKRIFQVSMIMYVRLKKLKKIKPKQYSLSKNYFEFLKKRTKYDNKDRKKLIFKY